MSQSTTGAEPQQNFLTGPWPHKPLVVASQYCKNSRGRPRHPRRPGPWSPPTDTATAAHLATQPILFLDDEGLGSLIVGLYRSGRATRATAAGDGIGLIIPRNDLRLGHGLASPVSTAMPRAPAVVAAPARSTRREIVLFIAMFMSYFNACFALDGHPRRRIERRSHIS